MDVNRDVVLLDEDRDADGHGGHWRAAKVRAGELVEPLFTRYAAGWGWSSWHLARDLVAVSVFVLAHRLRSAPERITGGDVVELLGDAARRHWTDAHSEAYGARDGYRVPAVYSHLFDSADRREYQRGLDLWHTARRAQTETLRRQVSAGLSAAGVNLDDGEDALVRTWRWLNQAPAPSSDSESSFPPEVRQEYLREAAEYAISLLGVRLRDVTAGRAVSDLQRDGWWRGRIETDEHGHVYVTEEPTRPGEPQLPGSMRTVMIIAGDGSAHDSTATVTNAGTGDVLVIERDSRIEHSRDQDRASLTPELSLAPSAAAALTTMLSTALDRVPTARMVLIESQPELWDGLWRLGPGQGLYQHVEVEPRVPFAPEVIGAALLGWHDWRTQHMDPSGDPADPAHGWTASTVLVRVPTQAEWIPINVTPIST